MKMNLKIYSATAAVLVLILMPRTAAADILHLKNGKALKVEKAWQDSDQIWFIHQGLTASIPQSKVARIEFDAGVPEKSGTSENGNIADINQNSPRPAVQLQPNQIEQTDQFDLAAQASSLPSEKELVLRKDGFNELKWGVRLAVVKGLKKRPIESGLDGVSEYVRPTDVLKLGNAALTTVIYAFWQDQLYTVTIWTQGLANFKALHDAIFNQFGAGIQSESSGERYLWSDGLTDAMLKYDNDAQCGMLWMRSSELDRKIKLAKLISPTSYLKWMKSRK